MLLLLQLLVIATIIGSTQDSGTPCSDCVVRVSASNIRCMSLI